MFLQRNISFCVLSWNNSWLQNENFCFCAPLARFQYINSSLKHVLRGGLGFWHPLSPSFSTPSHPFSLFLSLSLRSQRKCSNLRQISPQIFGACAGGSEETGLLIHCSVSPSVCFSPLPTPPLIKLMENTTR